MSKVMIACCTLRNIDLGPYIDHMRLWYRIGRDFPEIEFLQMTSKRMSIDRFRNTAAKVAIEQNCEAILFIDDDMLLPWDTFHKLYAAPLEYGVVAALNYIRGYPFKIMSFKWDISAQGKRLVNLTEEDLSKELETMVPCVAVGTAVCLIRTEALRRTPAPWFITGPHNTEDIYMCLKITDYNPDIKIGTHTGVITGHVLDSEVISYFTREAHLDYIEHFMSEDAVIEARQEYHGGAQVNRGKQGLILTYEEIMGAELVQPSGIR